MNNLSNFERMLLLAEEVFAVRSDPDQLNVDDAVLEKLKQIHPATVSAYDNGNGPVAWVLIIPTTLQLMDQFLNKKISERELFERTPLQGSYEAIYLCSAMVLEEFRRQGIAGKLTMDAIDQVRKLHPVKYLFVWPFTEAGEKAAEKLAEKQQLVLKKRAH
jgi:GNAT superfamily N-acetyltransferase